MPKVELHVHLEGSIRPGTLLELAGRHGVTLPATSANEIREWYRFVDFQHFAQVYLTISECIRTPNDIEFVAREFLAGQATQNIRYSEVTFTPYIHYLQNQMPFEQQLDALSSAREWGERELGVSMGFVIDIPRNIDAALGPMIAEWAISGMDAGVVAFGLGGPEDGHPPEKFSHAFARTLQAGLPSVPHAGEMVGPASIWGALRLLGASRIGHGVRCVEDARLVEELCIRQIPLEVCPTSNVCLGVFPDMANHPLAEMIDRGLYVTINSDDPPMFNTTLTHEYDVVRETFNFDVDLITTLADNAVRASFLPEAEKTLMLQSFRDETTQLRREVGM